jgi:hypothetical protein
MFRREALGGLHHSHLFPKVRSRKVPLNRGRTANLGGDRRASETSNSTCCALGKHEHLAASRDYRANASDVCALHARTDSSRLLVTASVSYMARSMTPSERSKPTNVFVGSRPDTPFPTFADTSLESIRPSL